MKKFFPASCAFVLFSLVLIPAANAQTVVLEPVKDNTLFESSTGNLSNGAGQYLFSGRTLQDPGNYLRRGLLAFDVAGSVPSGAVIDSVTLQLTVSKTITGASNVALHEVTQDWGEGTTDTGGEEGPGSGSTTDSATWIHTFFDTATWTTAGGDFDASASATQMVGSEDNYVWGSTAALVADVQGWLDAPSTNFGWILLGDESGTSAKRYNSREDPTAATRPQLTINYSVSPEILVDGFESGDCAAWSTGSC